MEAPTERYDVIVVGAGFGGLGAALTAAERGARVLLLESLNYPGGCASTFQRSGYAFEAGATLFSGFGPGQLFHDWMERHGMSVSIDFMDPVVHFRTPSWSLDVSRNRTDFFRSLASLPDTPMESIVQLERAQRQVADVLWELLDNPDELPPMKPSALLAHLRRSPRYLMLLPYLGRSLGACLQAWGVPETSGLRTYLNALCQITIQCSAEEAESTFALGTMDYYFRGTGHVRGGIGRLAWAFVETIQGLGQDVLLAHRVKCIRREEGEWVVEARGRRFRGAKLLANLLPADLERLRNDVPDTRMEALQQRVEAGWGAAMLYWVVEPPPSSSEGGPRHYELVQDEALPLTDGNHLFVSISGEEDEGRAPEGLRTVTTSTHVHMARLQEEGGRYVAEVQERMRQGLGALLPDWWQRRRFEMTASPRTFQRFTGRSQGFVGGIPRRRSLQHYSGVFPRPVEDGLYLVGDSVFPGQSTLATAIGGRRTARAALSKAWLFSR
ncbi:MAG: FAD-dependent oxidoreductase [Myxococcota bacterium]